MSDQLFEVTISATAEVRDADGNLISSTPVESTTTMTAAEVSALMQGDQSGDRPF